MILYYMIDRRFEYLAIDHVIITITVKVMKPYDHGFESDRAQMDFSNRNIDVNSHLMIVLTPH